jgi:sugar-specific transcriptional regulator TrmB
MIDRFREQIQQRLDELSSDAERLRMALAALDPRPSATHRRRPRSRPSASRARDQASAAATTSATNRQSARRRTRRPAATDGRSAPGATKAAVLGALADGDAMTASEVAAKAGLGRATVSTTLSKLAKSGEVQKASRGYRLARR